MKKVAWVLVIVGAVNWGLIGLGGLFFNGEINLVSMLLGYGVVAKIVYLLVGISGAYLLIGHCGYSYCKDCINGKCDTHKGQNPKM